MSNTIVLLDVEYNEKDYYIKVSNNKWKLTQSVSGFEYELSDKKVYDSIMNSINNKDIKYKVSEGTDLFNKLKEDLNINK